MPWKTFVCPPEMGANRVQLKASSRGQQPLPGQPQCQDGRTHPGDLQPQPQPAVEIHPQFTIIGAGAESGKSWNMGGDTNRLLRPRWRDGNRLGEGNKTRRVEVSLSPLISAASPVYAPLPHLKAPGKQKKKKNAVGEGLVDHGGVKYICWTGGDSGDHNEDKSMKRLSIQNYIPQCFSWMVQMTKEFFGLLLSVTLGENRALLCFYFVIILFSY